MTRVKIDGEGNGSPAVIVQTLSTALHSTESQLINKPHKEWLKVHLLKSSISLFSCRSTLWRVVACFSCEHLTVQKVLIGLFWQEHTSGASRSRGAGFSDRQCHSGSTVWVTAGSQNATRMGIVFAPCRDGAGEGRMLFPFTAPLQEHLFCTRWEQVQGEGALG